MGANGATQQLIIVGAGGNGREVAQHARDLARAGAVPWAISGFLDDNPEALVGRESGSPPLLGSITDWEPRDDQLFVLTIGAPSVRAKVASRLTARGARFTSIIHPSAHIADSARLGEGVVAYPFTYVSVDTSIGNHVQLNLHTSVGHDASIGDYSVLSSYCDVTGGVRIGTRVLLGSHVGIAPGLSIGDDALVGMGSVVVNSVRAGKRVFGNPAKTLKL